MRKLEFLDHEREAARYRRLLINVTTPALKTRLTEQAREHERLAEAVEIGEKPMPAVFEPGNGRRLTLRL
jgi:hypothetical protein